MSSRRVGNLGWRRRGSKIRRESKKVSIRTIPQVDQGFWKESWWEDANNKDVRSHNRFKGGICIKERKNLSLIQRRERKSKRIYSGANKEGIYLTIKFTTNCTGILCRKEG